MTNPVATAIVNAGHFLTITLSATSSITLLKRDIVSIEKKNTTAYIKRVEGEDIAITSATTYDGATYTLNNLIAALSASENAPGGVQTLVTAKNLTNAYADFGAEINVSANEKLTLFIATDVNASENVTLQILGILTTGSSEYSSLDQTAITLWSTGASDGFLTCNFDVTGFNLVQVQAKAGTVGATAGDLTISYRLK